jgi:uncharacterized membrane protein (UPF0182 family)
VAYENKIAMEETLEAGLAKLFGASAGQPRRGGAEQAVTPAAPGDAGMENLLLQATAAYEAAIRAQKDGDWAGYGEEIKKLGEILNKLR